MCVYFWYYICSGSRKENEKYDSIQKMFICSVFDSVEKKKMLLSVKREIFFRKINTNEN